jgi:hypothetical protein
MDPYGLGQMVDGGLAKLHHESRDDGIPDDAAEQGRLFPPLRLAHLQEGRGPSFADRDGRDPGGPDGRHPGAVRHVLDRHHRADGNTRWRRRDGAIHIG